MKTVFVDGGAGTTGLRIRERLSARTDICVLALEGDARKDAGARKEAYHSCDLAFLCLPDNAAREAVALAEGADCVIVDSSSAHRVDERFAYGFPELSEAHARAICASKFISVPGCHASGFVALVYPLIAAGILNPAAKLCCHSVTGFSGGGKKMIEDYASGRDGLASPRQYALTQTHKHLPEMKARTGLQTAPAFCPIVSNFYSGMLVTVPLFQDDLLGGARADDVRGVYERVYTGPVVKYERCADEGGFLRADALSGRDDMQVLVEGNDDRILLIARFDNLGKGASGAAVECMNLAFGMPPTAGLIV